MKKERLASLVGADNLLDDPEALRSYSSDHSFASPRRPELVVKPTNAAQVQDLIKLAAETKTPLIPVSSGEPRFRGDTIPTLGGVVVDMSAMNEVKMVDRIERVAMIEPGVTFGELQPALHKEGLRLPAPLCPRATKSVMGSCLEREPHIIPKYHLDHSDPLLCNEITFGTGDIFRTGEAGGPGTIEEQQAAGRYQKVHMGMQVNLNQIIQGSQGSFGIVTWSTVKCELLPKAQKSFLAGSENIEQVLELAYRMVRWRLGDELFILNDTNFALLMGKDAADTKRLKAELPPWILFFCLAGYKTMPEERIAYQEKDTAEIAKNLGIPIAKALCDVSAKAVLTRVTNPSPQPYWKLRAGGGCQDIPFISYMEKLPELVDVMKREASGVKLESSNLGVYIQPVCQGHGHHCEFSLYYDAADETESDRGKNLYLSSTAALMDSGAFFSRPYDLLAEIIINRDGASRDALRKLKGIFDPDSIMNPGKLCF